MILVTGGLGFIGSHTIVEILGKQKDIVVIDNLFNSSLDVIDKIKSITNRNFLFEKVDLLDINDVFKVFEKHKITEVIHFAGYKSVKESVKNPILYYENNVVGTLNLLKVMQKFDVHKLIFSSSATVYGVPEYLPYDENHPTCAVNPYGQTKLVVENLFLDYAISNPKFKCIILRYFNPIGSHESGVIGDDPKGIPNNLIPYINKVIVGKLPFLQVFGDDYQTDDGTGVRDYIHVCDLAYGHYLALLKLDDIIGVEFYNLGTGKGYSVLEILKTYSEVIGREIPYKIFPKREGDLPCYYADSRKIEQQLGFVCKYSIYDMCKDSYNFIMKNYKKGIL